MSTPTIHPDVRQAALQAAADAAERLDVPITMRQLAAIVDAAAPHFRGRAGEVPASATRLILQGLTAAGWPRTVLAARLGRSNGDVGLLMQQAWVKRSTQRAVADLFMELYGLDPAEHGAHPRGVARARNLAAREGWQPLNPDAVARLQGEVFDAAC